MWSVTSTTFGISGNAVISDFSQLAVDCERHRAGPVAADLLRHQLAVLLLRIALLAGPPRLWGSRKVR